MDARERIARLDWWHTIEVAPGVLTPGPWDLRATAQRIPWPGPLDGLRCLDVGTMDGFWAFELERRGAAEVVAIDVVEPRRETFPLAKELLGSRAELRQLDVHELAGSDIGEFDLVFIGYVLQLVRDPLRALEAIRRVCRGHVIVLDTVSLPLSLLPAPLARLDARRDGSEWFVFNRRGLRKLVELGGFAVDAVTPILRDRYRPRRERPPVSARAMYRLGVRGRSAAVRGRPVRPGA